MTNDTSLRRCDCAHAMVARSYLCECPVVLAPSIKARLEPYTVKDLKVEEHDAFTRRLDRVFKDS